MDIQKVREDKETINAMRERMAGLRDCRREDNDLFDGLTFCIGELYHVQQRLAELEKPADEDYWREMVAAIESTDTFTGAMEKIGCEKLQQYAEAYHARKMEEANQ